MQAYKGLYEEQLQVQYSPAKSYRSLDRKTSDLQTTSVSVPTTSATEATTTLDASIIKHHGQPEHNTEPSPASTPLNKVQGQHLPSAAVHSEKKSVGRNLATDIPDGNRCVANSPTVLYTLQSTRAEFFVDACAGIELEDASDASSAQTAAESAAAVATAAAAVATAAGALAIAAASGQDEDSTLVQRQASSTSLSGVEECARGLVFGVGRGKETGEGREVDSARVRGRREGWGLYNDTERRPAHTSSEELAVGFRIGKNAKGQHEHALVVESGAKREKKMVDSRIVGDLEQDKDKAGSPTGSDLTAETQACSPVGVGEGEQAHDIALGKPHKENRVGVTFENQAGQVNIWQERATATASASALAPVCSILETFRVGTCDGCVQQSVRCSKIATNINKVACQQARAQQTSKERYYVGVDPYRAGLAAGDVFPCPDVGSQGSLPQRSDSQQGGGEEYFPEDAPEAPREQTYTRQCVSREASESFAVPPNDRAPSQRGRRPEGSKSPTLASTPSWAESCASDVFDSLDAPKRSTSPVSPRRVQWAAASAGNRTWGRRVESRCTRIEPSRTRPNSI